MAKTQVILAVLSRVFSWSPHYRELSLDHLSLTYISHICRTGAIKGAWERDAFACDFGQRCRRQYLPYCQGAFVKKRA